jgi:LuxR family quorum sensing-dependent transcriptional regulator
VGKQIRQIAFEAVEKLSAAPSTDAIMASLNETGRHFGYENFSISGIPLPGERIDPYIMACGWPDGWAQRYRERQYVEVDPVIRRIRSSSMPFAWDEAPPAADDQAGAVMLEEAKDFGLVQGFAVPIYTTHGFQAIVSFGARQMELTSDEKAALHLVGIYAHSAIRSKLPSIGQKHASFASKSTLSRREIECLSWTAHGKTAWEISCILSLSQRTVEHYLESACRKLSCVGRTHAVAEALRQRLIA